jgi:predicted metalloprotease
MRAKLAFPVGQAITPDRARFLIFLLMLSLLLPSAVGAQPEVSDDRVDTAVFDEPADGTYTYENTVTYVEYVIQHADTVWTNWMTTNGYQEPQVTYNIVGLDETYTMGCTDASGAQATVSGTTANAYYCSGDETLYLPLQAMYELRLGDILGRQSAWPGDFALATLVAHEFGHHIVHEMAVQANSYIPTTSERRELMADCFAGVWTYAAQLDNLLVQGDIEEAVNALYVVGSYDFGNPDFHGTPDQRVTAWEIGFYGSAAYPYGGVPGNCITAYWG